MNSILAEHKLRERKKIQFWLVVGLLFFTATMLYAYFFPGPKCLRTETVTKTETYYDFSQSGMGVWQAPVTKTICTEWEQPSK